jgi:TetR/AcrR family transcriptional repressor of mexJK operon
MSPERRTTGRGKRDAVLDAAVELLLLHGYDGTSMDAVAARAGVSKTTVYAHFADKLELFQAVMRHGGEALGTQLHELREREDAVGGTAEDRLVAVLVATSRAAAGAEAIAYFRVMIAELHRRREIQAAFASSQADVPDVPDLVTIVGELLVAYAAENGFALDRPEVHATMMLKMTASGIQLDRLVSDFTLAPEQLEAHVAYIARVFLRGLRPIDGVPMPDLPTTYHYPWGPALT